MFLDVRQGFVFNVSRTFKFNDAITRVCLTYHLRSHVNRTPQSAENKRLKIEMLLEISEKINYSING